MNSNYNLPEKHHFKKGGIFYKSKLQINRPLPFEMMSYIFPDYTEILFKQKPSINKKTLQKVKEYCIATKKLALKEERQQIEADRKQNETKDLEEKIRIYFNNYYQNLYKACTCINKQTQ